MTIHIPECSFSHYLNFGTKRDVSDKDRFLSIMKGKNPTKRTSWTDIDDVFLGIGKGVREFVGEFTDTLFITL